MLRVAQLNIGSLFEPDWDRRRHEIAAWVERLDADVICFEEVWESDTHPNTAGEVVSLAADAGVTGYHWHFGGVEPVAKRAPTGARYGSAIVSRWPIESFTYDRLPLGENPPSSVAAFPWEIVHARTAGLDVFAAHLTAAPQDCRHRRAQVVFIDELIAERRGRRDALGCHDRPVMPPILCGDFNAEPDSDEVRFLRGFTSLAGRSTFWQDAFAVAGDGPGWTQDWRANQIASGMNVVRKRIDYVFVGDPFYRRGGGGRVLRCEVVFDEPLTGIVASDHAGLVVELTWPDRPAVRPTASM